MSKAVDRMTSSDCCDKCGRELRGMRFYGPDGTGPFCLECCPSVKDTGDRVTKPYKPLKWRTGPVPEGMTVFFHYFLDGFGDDYEVGVGRDDGHIGGYYTIEWQDTRWLPLSEILELIGG